MQNDEDTKVTAKKGGKWYSTKFSQTTGVKARSGRRRELGDVVSEHLDALYSYAFVISGNRKQAEVLVQETCANAIQIGNLPENSQAKIWLLTILRKIFLQQLQQQRTPFNLAEPDENASIANAAVDTLQDPRTSCINKVEPQRMPVRQSIQQLPAHFREIIVLREFEELSYGEIATLLNCSAGTVITRLARSRSRLREVLLEVRPPLRRREEGER